MPDGGSRSYTRTAPPPTPTPTPHMLDHDFDIRTWCRKLSRSKPASDPASLFWYPRSFLSRSLVFFLLSSSIAFFILVYSSPYSYALHDYISASNTLASAFHTYDYPSILQLYISSHRIVVLFIISHFHSHLFPLLTILHCFRIALVRSPLSANSRPGLV